VYNSNINEFRKKKWHIVRKEMREHIIEIGAIAPLKESTIPKLICPNCRPTF
jgi:hypothetical protein